MSSLKYSDDVKGYDVNGYRLQRVILNVPVTFNYLSDGSIVTATGWSANVEFWVGYNCTLGKSEGYTTYGTGTVLKLFNGEIGIGDEVTGYKLYFSIHSYPEVIDDDVSISLTNFLANQIPGSAGVVDNTLVNPVVLYAAREIEYSDPAVTLTVFPNLACINNHQVGPVGFEAKSWIWLNGNNDPEATELPIQYPILLSNTFTSKENAQVKISYYDSDNEFEYTENVVKLVSCANAVPAADLDDNQITFETLYDIINSSFTSFQYYVPPPTSS